MARCRMRLASRRHCSKAPSPSSPITPSSARLLSWCSPRGDDRYRVGRPGGNITSARVELGYEIYGKRLQILKEADPSASKVAYLIIRTFWESASGQQIREQLRQASPTTANLADGYI